MKFSNTFVLPASDSHSLLARLTISPLRMHLADLGATVRRQLRGGAPSVSDGDGGRSLDYSDYTLFEARPEQRGAIEAFIRRSYEKNFSARIDAFMPRLFGLRDRDGNLCSAFGLRTTSGKLFLEQYLQRAIETEISAHCGRAVARTGVVEIGNFCGAFPGAARAMIFLLTQHLRAENFTWVTFTGTRALRNAFQRMGLTLLDIAPADSLCLPEATRANWGSYYQHAPRVMAGEITGGYATLMATAPCTAEQPA